MRRVAFYLFYDPQGQVDDYVLHALSHLRPHVEHVFVVSQLAAGRHRPGRSRGASRTGSGSARTSASTCGPTRRRWRSSAPTGSPTTTRCSCSTARSSGPLDSFDALFAEMEAREDIDFWGITEHGPTRRHPFDRGPPDGRRTSSRTGSRSGAGWSPRPTGRSTGTRCRRSRPTRTRCSCTRAGSPRGSASGASRSAVAFPASDYGSKHPIIDNPVQMVRDGCPIVKRRSFFYDPLYHEAQGQRRPPAGRA